MTNQEGTFTQNELHNLVSETSNEYSYVSHGLRHIIGGYVEYAKLVVVDRAIPRIDGLKISQRRIIYALSQMKLKEGKLREGLEVKSDKVGTETFNYHPHNTEVIYETFSKFVDEIKYSNFPLFKAESSFGHRNVAKSTPASRYTAFSILPTFYEFIRELDGVKWGYTEDDNLLEPKLLPVSVPFGLLHPSVGIGVGTGSSNFAYRAEDIAKGVEDTIRHGRTERVFIPDFPTGGHLQNQPEVFEQIMETGKGTIRLATQYTIEGKTIELHDMHYYMDLEKVKEQIIALDLPEIKTVKDTSDSTPKITITCSRAEYTDYVLKRILKETSAADTASANMVTIIDDMPKLIGVREYLQEWVKFRTEVLTTFFNKELTALQQEKERLETLIDFTSNQTLVKQFIDELYISRHKGIAFLKKHYPDIKEKIVNTILTMQVSSLADKQTRRNQLEKRNEDITRVEGILNNLGDYIINQVNGVCSRFGTPRKTQLVDIDLTFKDVNLGDTEEETVVDVYVEVEDNFIRKYHLTTVPEDHEERGGVWCKSDDYISIMDSQARLMRINLAPLPFWSYGDRGTYIPTHLEIHNEEEGHVIAFDVMERDVKKAYLYQDGFASVLDFNEWLDARYVTKLTVYGMPETVNLIMAEIDLSKEFTIVHTSEGRMGVFANDFKQKNRTARTKVMGLNKNKNEVITYAVSVEQDVLLQVFGVESFVDITLDKVTKPSVDVNFTVFNALLGF